MLAVVQARFRMASLLPNRSRRALAIQHTNSALPIILCLSIYLLNLIQPVSAVLTTCYDPSGNVRGDVPCNQGAVQSPCCADGWGMFPGGKMPDERICSNCALVCTNTSLCVAGPSVVLNPGDPEQFEGSCTDKTWNSPLCPSFCRTGMLKSKPRFGRYKC